MQEDINQICDQIDEALSIFNKMPSRPHFDPYKGIDNALKYQSEVEKIIQKKKKKKKKRSISPRGWLKSTKQTPGDDDVSESLIKLSDDIIAILEDKGLISESMTVHVDGFDYSSQIDHLGDICGVLAKTIYKRQNQLSKEELDHLIEVNMPGQIVVPDGDADYSGREGIINFYTAGLPQKILADVIQEMRQILDSNNIKYGEFKTEKSGMIESEVIRIPILQIMGEKQGPIEPNFANTNAKLLFSDILEYQMDEDDWGYYLDAYDVINRIDKALDDVDVLSIHSRDPHQSKGVNIQGRYGATMMHGGYDFNSIRRGLDNIKKVCEWAIKNGYTKINVN